MNEGTSHRIELVWRDGGSDRIDASAGQSVLDAAEEAGLALPFGCGTGACAPCTGKLLDGSIEHRRPPRR